MYGLTRATTTLIFAGTAGLVIWIATQIGNGHTGGYWARMGLVAGAGLLMALSQVIGGWTKWGRPRLSAAVLLTAFVPVAIVSAWIIVFGDPSHSWVPNHVRSWSGDIHVTGLVKDLGFYGSVLAFGTGLVLGFSFDTMGPATGDVGPPTGRQRKMFGRRSGAPPATDSRAADEPLTADRDAETTARRSDRETLTRN
jgi:hypothetical protein